MARIMNFLKNAKENKQLLIAVFIVAIIVLTVYYMVVKLKRDYEYTMENEPWLLDTNVHLKDPHICKTGGVIESKHFKEAIDNKHGVELSYSFWLYVNDWKHNDNKWKHLFHKGNNNIGLPLQSPGFWLYPKENKLAINMNTYYSIKESCDIDNIPLNKWINICFVLINKNIDIYVNGKLRKRCTLKGIPKLNYGDLYLTQHGGFDGFLSKLRYYNYALPIYKIEELMRQGPSKKSCTTTKLTSEMLHRNWYLSSELPNDTSYPGQSTTS